jgi:hypothetical protein
MIVKMFRGYWELEGGCGVVILGAGACGKRRTEHASQNQYS